MSRDAGMHSLVLKGFSLFQSIQLKFKVSPFFASMHCFSIICAKIIIFLCVSKQ